MFTGLRSTHYDRSTCVNLKPFLHWNVTDYWHRYIEYSDFIWLTSQVIKLWNINPGIHTVIRIYLCIHEKRCYLQILESDKRSIIAKIYHRLPLQYHRVKCGVFNVTDSATIRRTHLIDKPYSNKNRRIRITVLLFDKACWTGAWANRGTVMTIEFHEISHLLFACQYLELRYDSRLVKYIGSICAIGGSVSCNEFSWYKTRVKWKPLLTPFEQGVLLYIWTHLNSHIAERQLRCIIGFKKVLWMC